MPTFRSPFIAGQASACFPVCPAGTPANDQSSMRARRLRRSYLEQFATNMAAVLGRMVAHASKATKLLFDSHFTALFFFVPAGQRHECNLSADAAKQGDTYYEIPR